MSRPSLWEVATAKTRFPSLSQELHADAVIIGGGITGITAAMLLTQAGKRVVVLEAMKIGLGTTGYSTGNLHVLPDQNLHILQEKWDASTATAVGESRRATLDLMEKTVVDYGLRCRFSRGPHFIVPTAVSHTEQMEREYKAARQAGLPVSISRELPLPISAEKALRIDHQAQFHPLMYVQELAGKICSDTCRVYEHSKVIEIDEDRMIVHTAEGKVHARKIIMATHTPKGFNLLQTELGPYREYGLAARLKEGAYPIGIFWTFEDPSHSIRSYETNGTRYVIVIGEEHKTGQQEDLDYFQRVEVFSRSLFTIDTIDYRWSAQNYRPADHLPYIGRTFASDDIYVATGFATNGLLYGPLAAGIIADDILGRQNRWEEIYRARRLEPVKGGASIVKENLNVARQFIKLPTSAETGKAQDVKRGEGKLARVNGEEVAVYHDCDGGLQALSPVCTHLGCVVHWNRMEESWDCPCHGSRFRTDGEVIEGPALMPLSRKRVPAGD